MNRLRPALLLLTLCAVGACVPRRPAPPPPVAAPPPAPVVVVPRPTPTPPPPPPPNLAWTDAPLSPGNWSYTPSPQGSSARFGTAGAATLTVRCFGAGQVLISRSGASASNQLTFRTHSLARTVPAVSQPSDIGVTLPARDSLLDAMIFSRGRFAVEAAGLPTLIVPSWPELARVVEDCRAGSRTG